MHNDFDDATISVINQLFKELFAIKPAWRQSIGNQEELDACKRQWLIAFSVSNINSLEKLRSGLKKICLDPNPFFPSPGEFIALCKPDAKDLGAPELEQAYREACEKSHPSYGQNKNWSHPAVQWAARNSDSYFLRSESRTKTFPVFKKNYEQALQMYAEGKILDQIGYDRDNSRKTPPTTEKTETTSPPSAPSYEEDPEYYSLRARQERYKRAKKDPSSPYYEGDKNA